MKKLLGIFMAAVTVIAACMGLASCKNGDAGQGTEEPSAVGEFKSLKDAYEAGWITHDDLKSIAYYYNKTEDDVHEDGSGLYLQDFEEGFIPKPKEPETLSEETKNTIEQDGWIYFSNDHIYVFNYCGMYGNCIVMNLSFGSCMDGGGDPVYYETYSIGDVLFHWYHPLVVWRPIANE